MTPAEAKAFNAGIKAILVIAERSVATLTRAPRRIPISFAQAALAELARAGRELLVNLDSGEPGASAILPEPKPRLAASSGAP